LLKVNQTEAGKDYLRKALTARSDFGPALLALADVLQKEGDFTGAKVYIDLYLLTNRVTARSLWLAITNTLELDIEGEVEELARRLETDFPDSPEYQEWKQIQ